MSNQFRCVKRDLQPNEKFDLIAIMFISIDGIDGCGKSTQVQLLARWFEQRGQHALTVRDPGGTTLGESLREILLQRVEIPLGSTAEMLLFMASRAQLVEEVIEPAIAKGSHVISDRYLLSTVAYQACAGGLDPETIWRVGEIATRGTSPDRTFLLDLDPDRAFARIQSKLDRLESRGLDYMRKVREGFLEQGKRLGARLVVVDANQTPQAIHQQIISSLVSL